MERDKNKIEKGRIWLSSYLSAEADGCLSDKQKRRLFSIIYAKYRSSMREDDSFYSDVSAFVSSRRSGDEKEKFFFELMKRLVTQGIREEYYGRKDSAAERKQ